MPAEPARDGNEAPGKTILNRRAMPASKRSVGFQQLFASVPGSPDAASLDSQDLTRKSGMKQLTNLWRLMRPRQWVKSTFVFTGILFANAWRQPQLRLDVLLTAIAFSLTASGVYIINDLLDKESDLNHPSKQHRPLTAGAVSIAAAVSLMLLLEIGSLVLGFFVSGRSWEFYRSICF